MKKYLSLVVLGAGIFFSGLVLSSNVDAQTKGRRGESDSALSPSAKKAPPEARKAELQHILSDRASGKLAPTDPCTTAVVIALNQTISGTLATGDCLLSDGTFIDFYDFQGKAGQPVSILMNATFDSYLYLLDDGGTPIDENDDNAGSGTSSRLPNAGGVMFLPYTGHYIIGANSYAASTGAYSLSVNADSKCVAKQIFFNQTVNGSLATTDCAGFFASQPYYTDIYTFSGTAGQQISIAMSSTAVDSYLVLHTPSGDGTLDDDDSGGGSNARIPASNTFTLPETGTYTLEASSFTNSQTGNYTLVLSGPVTAFVTLTGRVVTPEGLGLKGALVTLTDSQNVKTTVPTTQFGYFSFTGIATGKSYTVSVTARHHTFDPRTLQITSEAPLDNFVGQPIPQ